MAKATDTAEAPEQVQPLVSETGIPKSKRGRQANEVDYSAYEPHIEDVKTNLGKALGFPNVKPKVAKDLKTIYGVRANMRNVDPEDGNKGTMWIEWPNYIDDETGDRVEDIDEVNENLAG